MLPAQSCLGCEGWRKSRLQIIRTNNYCEPVLEGCQLFIIDANQSWGGNSILTAPPVALPHCRNLTLNLLLSILNFLSWRCQIQFSLTNFLPKTFNEYSNIEELLWQDNPTAWPRPSLPAVCSFSILQVIGIIKRRTAPQKIPLRILWHELFWYKKSYDV